MKKNFSKPVSKFLYSLIVVQYQIPLFLRILRIFYLCICLSLRKSEKRGKVPLEDFVRILSMIRKHYIPTYEKFSETFVNDKYVESMKGVTSILRVLKFNSEILSLGSNLS